MSEVAVMAEEKRGMVRVRTETIIGGLNVGALARCSNASFAIGWSDAQCTGFSASASAHGPSIAIIATGGDIGIFGHK